MPATVSQLVIYPIKGMGGISVTHAMVTARGFVDDRRWMLVDVHAKFMSQREHPRMALITVGLAADALQVSAPGMPPLTLARQSGGTNVRHVSIWDSTCAAQSVGQPAAKWFTHFLDTPCDLVHMPDTTRRQVTFTHAQLNDIVSFADGFPFLLTNAASLDDLNAKLATPVSMNRFRPNIVLDGPAPWAEDTWRHLRIGAVTFRVAKPCARCVVININPIDASRTKEPLKTLARFRRQGKSVIFGQNLLPDTHGVVHVGDSVELQ